MSKKIVKLLEFRACKKWKKSIQNVSSIWKLYKTNFDFEENNISADLCLLVIGKIKGAKGKIINFIEEDING
jgi:hypothetical protein